MYCQVAGDITLWTAMQDLTFLTYPIQELIADMCITLCRMIKLAFSSLFPDIIAGVEVFATLGAVANLTTMWYLS